MKSSKGPLISIIVPVYNTEKYLQSCIDSILSQTFTDFELLLIDDGSKDYSGAICDEYTLKDSRVRVFHKENGGANLARKYGVEKSLSDWIMFVDADDMILSDCVDVLMQDDYINYDLVITDSYCDNNNVSPIEFVCDTLKRKLLFTSCARLYRKKILLEVMDIPNWIKIGEDLMVNMKYSLNSSVKNIKYIKKNFYNYRNNPQSATHTMQYSLNYEINVCKYLENILGGKKEYMESYMYFKLIMWKNLLLHGIDVPINSYILLGLFDFKFTNLTIGEKIMLKIPYSFILKYILKLLDLFRPLKYRLFKTCCLFV